MVNAVIASWFLKKRHALSSSSEEPLVLQAPPVPSTTTVKPCPWRSVLVTPCSYIRRPFLSKTSTGRTYRFGV
eukprot:symbB.v1.2.012045.t1/scaffold817.1/size160046/4